MLPAPIKALSIFSDFFEVRSERHVMDMSKNWIQVHNDQFESQRDAIAIDFVQQ